MNKNVYITGATGFIGSRLAKSYVDSGYNVSVLIREASSLRELHGLLSEINVFEYDGTQESIDKSLVESGADVVFHLASNFISEHSKEDIPSIISSNIEFGTRVLEAMNYAGVRKFINTGTSWQHYKSKDYLPVNLYAATKQAFDDILEYYIDANGFSAITLKLFDTYGPNDPRKKLLALLNSLAESGGSLDMSPGDQLIDLVFIDDVIEAFRISAVLVSEMPAGENRFYGVSSGEPVSLKKLVDVYSQVLGKDISINWGGRDYREREVMVPWKPKESLPGWSPKTGLYNGLKKL